MTNEPHNPKWKAALDLANAAPRCGARRKRDGQPCQRPAMANGRCWVHGGPSTEPRTPAGLERSRSARLKHGYYARAAIAERAEARAMTRALRDYMAAI